MSEPTAEELQAVAEVTQRYQQYITETPALLSLLYDIDLLPEQIRLYVNANRMVAVCELFKLIPPDVLAKAMTTPKTFEDDLAPAETSGQPPDR